MNQNSIEERIIEVVSETLQLSEQEQEVLRDKQAYKMLAKWTSARHPEIIVAIEDEYDFEIDERDIPRLNTLEKIVQYVQARQE